MIKHLDKQQQKNFQTALKHKNEKQYNSSIEMFEKLLLKDTQNISYLEELGQLYTITNNFQKSMDICNTIYFLQPLNGVNLNNLGICYFNLKNYEKAVEIFKQILQIKNDIPDVYNNISNCYINMKQYRLAESVINISRKLREDADIYFRLGNLYFYTKRYEDSIEYYTKLPKTHDNLYNLSFPYLALNQYLTGFELYENRLFNNKIHPQTGEIQRVEIPQIPDWDGKKPCKRLLVIYEQGIGDNIQYYRFMIEFSIRNPKIKITYFCKQTVSNILKPYPNIQVESSTVDITAFDYKMFIMSFPNFLKIDVIHPNTHDYILYNRPKIEFWKNKLSPLKKYKIGFVHNGLLSSFIEKDIPLIEFEKLSNNISENAKPNIDFICMCKLKEVENEITNMKNIRHFDIDKDAPFVDTISIMKNIDLLITIDTAIVHLAGVMGIKTWLLLGYGSDWRWSTKDTTFWYNSVEIIRMKENVELKNIMGVVKEKIDNIDF